MPNVPTLFSKTKIFLSSKTPEKLGIRKFPPFFPLEIRCQKFKTNQLNKKQQAQTGIIPPLKTIKRGQTKYQAQT